MEVKYIIPNCKTPPMALLPGSLASGLSVLPQLGHVTLEKRVTNWPADHHDRGLVIHSSGPLGFHFPDSQFYDGSLAHAQFGAQRRQ
jgi:hypothetical protein